MESTANGETKEATTNIDIPTVKRGHLNENHHKKGFLDFLKAIPSKDRFQRVNFVARISPFSFLQRSQRQSTGNNSSHPDPTTSTINGSHRFSIPFIRKLNWEAIVRYCKKWIKHPMNQALLVWLFFVAVCLVVLFLFMAGLLNHAIPKSSVRNKWTEIFNQILNALFTIMCLYQHPRISHHLVLLCRWRSEDIVELRNIYCKNGTRKPHERAHMMFAVILLHMTCLSQYGLCTLFWAYNTDTRPLWPQILFIAMGTVAPIIAAIYTFFGPLAKKTETEWIGGLFDCRNDQTVAYLSFFCTFCVFGWNMERHGFGNMYVHIFTFILLCGAPVVVFTATALNVNDVVIRYMVEIIGVVLCMLGLLYGGFWRIQMRKKFKLPENQFCCGYPGFTDFMQWLFCWSCSLAQEVRTGNFYDVEYGGFYRQESEEGNKQVMVPLPRENGAELMAFSSFGSARVHSELDYKLEIVQSGRGGEIQEVVGDEIMRPPLRSVIS